jgi:hypothetical protein
MKKIISLVLVIACVSNVLLAAANDIVIVDVQGNAITAYNDAKEAAVLREVVVEQEASFFEKNKIAILCTIGGVIVVVGTTLGLVLGLCKNKKQKLTPVAVTPTLDLIPYLFTEMQPVVEQKPILGPDRDLGTN